MKKYRIGYTQGTFDMFHIGHLNLLNNAKEYCERLIVGVNSDELVREYKHKTPVICEAERREIIDNIKAVDGCEIVSTLDKEDARKRFGFDAIFIGDDWKGDPRWVKTEHDMARHGVDVVYLPHTEGISSTALTDVITKILDDISSKKDN